MRDIQEIFNAVIDAGIYNDNKNQFMCMAVEQAAKWGVITHDESLFSKSQIFLYLNSFAEYHHAMLATLVAEYPEKYFENGEVVKQCLPIYKDWANRPKPKSTIQ